MISVLTSHQILLISLRVMIHAISLSIHIEDLALPIHNLTPHAIRDA